MQENDERIARGWKSSALLSPHSSHPCQSVLQSINFLFFEQVLGSSTFSVVHCGGDVEFTDGEVEHGD